MKKSKINRYKKPLFLIFFTIGLTFGYFGINNYTNNGTIASKNIKEVEEENFNNYEDIFPESSQIKSFNGSGKPVDIIVHQSLINSSLIEFSNLSESNSFIEPSPTFIGFNTSYTKIDIDDIYAPNKTLEVETNPGFPTVLTLPYYTSFEVPTDCYLNAVEININAPATGSIFTYDVFDAKYENNYIRPDTDLTGGGFNLGTKANDSNTDLWLRLDGLNELLNATESYNNTFFIYISASDVFSSIWNADNTGDDTISYNNPSGNPLNIDLTLKVELSPLNNTPKPSQINLELNKMPVSDSGQGSGYLETTLGLLSDYSGLLDFTIEPDWWDVSLNITNVQLNYTKSDITANTNFNIIKSSENVNWTVSVPGGLEYFDSRIPKYNTINYSIPSKWILSSLRIYDDSGLISSSNINDKLINPDLREIQVINAVNGTNWLLTANSTNLLTGVSTLVNGNPYNIVNFSNTVRFNAIFSEIIRDGTVNLSVYSPRPRNMDHTNTTSVGSSNTIFTISDWVIADDADVYGLYKVQMFWNNESAAGFYESYLTIAGDTELNVLNPPENKIYKSGESFQIQIQYNDTRLVEGVLDAEINYSLNNWIDSRYDNINYLGDGKYNITINVNDLQFPEFGFVDIQINASKKFYVNFTRTYTFHRQILTSITPNNIRNLGSVMRGSNVSYTFNYSDSNSNPIRQASYIVTNNSGFLPFLRNDGNGNYTMQLDTDNVDVTGYPKWFEFSVSAVGNETQDIRLIINVQIISTSIVNPNWDLEIVRKSGFNQSYTFFFNDTNSEVGIPDLETNDVVVKNNDTGTVWNTGDFNWRIINPLNDGNYILNISMRGKNSGWYTLEINITKSPNYDTSIDYITFYLKGNETSINLVSISDSGGLVKPTGYGNNYTVFEGDELTIGFNITDDDDDNNLVLGSVTSYNLEYTNLLSSSSGVIANNFQFSNPNHVGPTLDLSNLASGYYLMNISFTKLNYESSFYTFNLTIIEKYQVNLTIIKKPISINAGDSFNITIKATYFNGTIEIPLVNAYINLTAYFNGVPRPPLAAQMTNGTGEVKFEVTVQLTATSMSLRIWLTSDYYHVAESSVESDISIIPYSPGFTLDELLPFIVLIGAIAAIAIGSIAVYRGVVVPKKREKQRVLTEVKTIFDDAINLEHILVLYKGTGTCIFFKSYGSEEIDPELISGFLTAVSSFGKEMVAQEALNEISYGDKMLLLADGEYVRVALVLGKKGSLILRTHLREFIERFEQVYKDVLPNWRGQLAYFRNAGEIVDDVLNTSIILPHQISYDFSSVKDLKNPHSKDVLKIAHNCCEETERKFFFIATLLQEAVETTNKDTAEIFMGIKELRDKKILIPIEISAIEAIPISQQEINLINQKVSQLTNLTSEEKQKLVNDLAQLGPAEREAYLSSLTEKVEIVSAPIKTTIGTVEVADKKSAKKEMKKLIKIAKSAKSKGDFSGSIEKLRIAAMIASNWDYPSKFINIQEDIRKTQIEDLKIKKKQIEKAAKAAVKQKIYVEAADKYKAASKIASEIFKLGDPSMTKEVKRLTNKANEFEKFK